MDEDFEFFLERFGPAFDRRDVPAPTIARYQGKLPDQLLAYWQEHGWCGYADGLLWMVDPQEYEPALNAWIGETAFMERDAYHVIARSAFGELYFWGERTGASLSVLPWRSMAVPSDGSPDLIAQGRADEVLRWRFAGFKTEHFELEDSEGKPLFQRAFKRLGRLKHDEMYGFVPALALGGPATLEHLQKVRAVEHLVLLAQLSEPRVMNVPRG
jgi:hypothetical protein